MGTGWFDGAVDFDPGPAENTLVSEVGLGAFVFKFDPDGEFSWAVGIIGTGDVHGIDVALADDGAVYCTGDFSGTVDFDPGPEVFEMTSFDEYDQFVLKLDSTGQFEWAWAINCMRRANALEIAIDALGGLFVAGRFYGTVDIDPGPSSFEVEGVRASGLGYFLAKYNAGGELVWGFAGEPQFDNIAPDDTGGVIVAGSFNRTTDFDPGPGVHERNRRGDSDAYVCFFDDEGEFRKVITLGGDTSISVLDFAVTEIGDICVVGTFLDGWIDFDPGPGSHVFSNNGPYRTPDGFICMLDASGDFQWARQIGVADEYEWVTDVRFDGFGNVYVSGFISQPVILDPGIGAFPPDNDWQGRVFLFRLDSTGVYDWAGAISTRVQRGNICIDAAGRIYRAGTYRTYADIDPGPRVYESRPFSESDGYVIRVESQVPPLATDDYGLALADEVLSNLIVPVSESVLTNDTDGNEAAVLTVAGFDAVSSLGAEVHILEDGTFTYDPTGVGALSELPEGDFIIDSFTYTVYDGLDRATGTVRIEVKGTVPALPVVQDRVLLLVILGISAVGFMRVYKNTRINGN